MDYHGRIMNIECVVPDAIPSDPSVSFKYGHRDARHAAAEIALEADQNIANLAYQLGSEKTFVDQLQRALNRWLPMVDESALGKEMADVAAADAYLLCGLMDFSGREFGREIVAAKDAQIARLREALDDCLPALEIGLNAAQVISVFGDDRGATIRDALTRARAALAPVAGVEP